MKKWTLSDFGTFAGPKETHLPLVEREQLCLFSPWPHWTQSSHVRSVVGSGTPTSLPQLFSTRFRTFPSLPCASVWHADISVSEILRPGTCFFCIRSRKHTGCRLLHAPLRAKLLLRNSPTAPPLGEETEATLHRGAGRQASI